MNEISNAEKELKKLIRETKKREFTKLSTEVRRLKKNTESLNNEFKEESSVFSDAVRQSSLYVGDYANIAKLGDQVKESFFAHLNTKEELDNLKNQHATIAAELGETIEKEMIESGDFILYDEPELYNLRRVADYPSGSREWLEARQKGIGGSDVGNILKLDPKWGSKDFKQVRESKIYPITDEQVTEQERGQLVFDNAASRGNAWEPILGKMYADANPEIQVFVCKASWAKYREPIMRVNFDFLVAKKKGAKKPDGLLEIKTGSNPKEWGNPEDGLDAVPAKYRAQVLHGIYSSKGLTWGSIAVLIDGHDFKYYNFTMTKELWQEAENNAKACRKFWKEILEDRKELSHRETTTEKPKKAPVKGFTSTLNKRGLYGNEARKNMITEISQVAHIEPQMLVKRYLSILETSNVDFEHRNATKAFENLYKATLIELFTRYDRVVSVDLETSGNSPTSGSIIEIGISVRDAKNNEIQKIDQLYGLPENEMVSGTGSVDVHNITLEDIQGKEVFSTPENQKLILDTLKSGVVIAHNKSFEVSWFRQYIPGFAQAELDGEIHIIDTMDLCRRFLIDAPGNRLQDFAEHFGIEYVDAHRAFKDSEMTADAFYKFIQSLSE